MLDRVTYNVAAAEKKIRLTDVTYMPKTCNSGKFLLNLFGSLKLAQTFVRRKSQSFSSIYGTVAQLHVNPNFSR